MGMALVGAGTRLWQLGTDGSMSCKIQSSFEQHPKTKPV